MLTPPSHSDPTATYLDATPEYLPTPAAACRIASAFPNAKLVVVLKDPVVRALSAWNMFDYHKNGFTSDFADDVSVGYAWAHALDA